MSDESPSVVETTDGLTIVYRGRNLYHPATPRRSAIARAEAVDTPDHSLLIVPSPLAGHGIEELLGRCGEHSHIVLIELEPALGDLARRLLSPGITRDPRVLLLIPHHPSEIQEQIPADLFSRCRRSLLVRLNGGYSFHARDYDRVVRWTQDEIRRSWQNRLTTMHMGRLWFRNLFDNLPMLCGSGTPEHIVANRPIVVVGAGPSLESVLGDLLTHRDSLVLVAVDTAVPVLGAAGIAPDYVVAVEAQHANLTDFLGTRHGNPDLCADLFSLPAVIRRFPRQNRHLFISRALQSRLLDRLREAALLPTEIPPLGSVGVVAVDLAVRMTPPAIALTGLDFAYPDGKTHARGAPWMVRELLRTSRLRRGEIYGACLARPRVSVPGKTGEPCRSDLVLLSYAEQLRALTARTRNLYDIDGCGLPSGAPRISSISELMSPAGDGGSKRCEVRRDRVIAPQAVLRFLQAERELVAATREAALRTAENPSTETRAELLRTLAETDYVSCGIPLDPETPEAARPLAAAAGFFLIRIDRAIARFRSSDVG